MGLLVDMRLFLWASNLPFGRLVGLGAEEGHFGYGFNTAAREIQRENRSMRVYQAIWCVVDGR